MADNKVPFLEYADAMRVIAICGVVVIHSSGYLVTIYDSIPLFKWVIANIMDSMSRWAMPTFIMLSGALLLDPLKKENINVFYTKRLKRIAIPLIFWAAFYFVWDAYFHGHKITVPFVIKSFYEALPERHLYFVFIIMGLYLVTPLLRILTKYNRVYTLLFLVLFFMTISVTGYIFNILPTNAFTIFVPYIGYFISGFLLRNIPLTKKTVILSIFLFLLSTAFICIGTYFQINRFGTDDYRAYIFYDHFNMCVIMQTFSMFVIVAYFFSETSNNQPTKFFKILGPAAFGIYLVHHAILDYVGGVLIQYKLNLNITGILFEIIATFTLSAIISVILLKIPYMRRIIS